MDSFYISTFVEGHASGQYELQEISEGFLLLPLGGSELLAQLTTETAVAKGQIISKAIFVFLTSPKKTNENDLTLEWANFQKPTLRRQTLRGPTFSGYP